MSLNMSIRIIIKIFLAIQLLLLVFRQLIDFAGIQWLMILVNAAAIIVTITAFFGHLMLYAYFQAFLIAYNIFVICVYARFIVIRDSLGDNFISSTDHNVHSLNSDKTYYQSDFMTPTHPALPSTQLLSFDANSRSFWYVIVSNHVSELHAISSSTFPRSTAAAIAAANSAAASPERRLQPSLMDESLVDLCVQYIEIAIAALHIFFSLLGIGLILLKYKLQRDKLFRNNDKTTPPLPPYTISPQMNHYMSYTPTQPYKQASSSKSSSIYATNNSQSSLRRSRKRRSTRSLHSSKSKANSMGALNIRSTSTGSLRSISKQSHRKSATSLLNDTSFSNNTIGSRGGGGGNSRSQSKGIYQSMVPATNHAGVRTSNYIMPGSSGQHHPQQQQQQQYQTTKFLTSDSETDYYQTFTPHYVNNGLHNPLYGNRHSYLNDSETAI